MKRLWRLVIQSFILISENFSFNVIFQLYFFSEIFMKKIFVEKF